MSPPEAALRRCWRMLAGPRGDAHLEGLLARHREPHRRYHTAVHVMWVLRHIDHLLADVPGCTDGDAVRAAGLFHDAIYEPTSSTNERDSAALASTVLEDVGWTPARVAWVAALIEATAHTSAAMLDGGVETGGGERAAMDVLLDADLAILGADPAAYQAYVNGVRSEYAHVDAAAWRAGRSAVLRHFLDQPAIFRTAAMSAQREQRARANIAAELASLATG